MKNICWVRIENETETVICFVGYNLRCYFIKLFFVLSNNVYDLWVNQL